MRKSLEFLLHRYLYNLQKGMSSLNRYNTLIFDEDCDTIQFDGMTIYVRPVRNSAWQAEDTSNTPVLLSDGGAVYKKLVQISDTDLKTLELSEIELGLYFKSLVSFQTPQELAHRYNLDANSVFPSLVCLTHVQNLSQQLCSYIAFLITVKDLYFKQAEKIENTYSGNI